MSKPTIGDKCHFFEHTSHLTGIPVHAFALGAVDYFVVQTDDKRLIVCEADGIGGFDEKGNPGAFGFWAPGDVDRDRDGLNT